MVGQPVRVAWSGPGGDAPFSYLWDVDGTGYARGAGAPNGNAVTLIPASTAARVVKARVANADGQWVESQLTVRPVAAPATPATPTAAVTKAVAPKLPSAVAKVS